MSAASAAVREPPARAIPPSPPAASVRKPRRETESGLMKVLACDAAMRVGPVFEANGAGVDRRDEAPLAATIRPGPANPVRTRVTSSLTLALAADTPSGTGDRVPRVQVLVLHV